MYGLRCNFCIVLIVFAFYVTAGEVSDKRKEKADTIFVSLPINSKFWNPQLDDKTNMELIGAEYLNDFNKTVLEVLAKSLTASASNSTSKGRKAERFFVWGLLNMLKPMAWSSGLPDAKLRIGAKSKRGPN